MKITITTNYLRSIKQVNIYVVHTVLGRTRLRLERGYRDHRLMQNIAEILVCSLPEVKDFTINPLTGSIVLVHQRVIFNQLVSDNITGPPPGADTLNVLLWSGVMLFIELPLAIVLLVSVVEIICLLLRRQRLTVWHVLRLAVDVLPYIRFPKALCLRQLKCLRS
ncbi:MAG: hypothetical protein HY986_26400 [Candidatus Melainabacteria bacterium]|nr:hypothetical protein [Candidatus Melainabacteria bacterium]